MKPIDILEWTMGWAWPVIIVLLVLIAWGIERLTAWGEKETEDHVSNQIQSHRCTCV